VVTSSHRLNIEILPELVGFFVLRLPSGGLFYFPSTIMRGSSAIRGGSMSAEPITATVTAGVAAGTTGVTFATLFPEATPAVMVCSLAGAALYILSSEDHKIWKQILFALISFIGGIYCAGTASEIIAALINAGLNQLSPPVTIKVSPAIGALAASTVSVTILLRILARSKTGNLPGVKGEE